jgi:hypothetical protein
MLGYEHATPPTAHSKSAITSEWHPALFAGTMTLVVIQLSTLVALDTTSSHGLPMAYP